MDAFKRKTINDYTWNDLNCRKVVKHTRQQNKTEKEIKRKARRTLKHKLKIDILEGKSEQSK